jgi:hypothetical protein
MLTLSIPAAPRLRLTFRKARCIRSGVILPVNEWALILAILGPFLLNPLRRNHREVRGRRPVADVS